MKLIIIMSIFLPGCAGGCQKMKAEISGHTEVCVDGITYMQFPTGTVLKVHEQGLPVGCK